VGAQYLEDWLTKRNGTDEKAEWNGTGIKTEWSVPFFSFATRFVSICNPFIVRLPIVVNFGGLSTVLTDCIHEHTIMLKREIQAFTVYVYMYVALNF
jgi:hypothetical protein